MSVPTLEDLGDVAGEQESVFRDGAPGCIWVPPVAKHDLGAPHSQLPELPWPGAFGERALPSQVC